MKYLLLQSYFGLLLGLPASTSARITYDAIPRVDWRCDNGPNSAGVIRYAHINAAMERSVGFWDANAPQHWLTGEYPHGVRTARIQRWVAPSIRCNNFIVGSAPIPVGGINNAIGTTKPGIYRALISESKFENSQGDLVYQFCGVATHPEPARPGITYEMCRPVTALDEEESEDIVFS